MASSAGGAAAAPSRAFAGGCQRGLPFVIKAGIEHWGARQWTAESLASSFGSLPVCVRLHRRGSGDVYEGECVYELCLLGEFCAWLKGAVSGSLAVRYPQTHYVGYCDYQDMVQLFANVPQALGAVDWSFTGVPRDGVHTTLWLGSEGAHTPTHYDTYGSNVVAQLAGTKRWRLHPPGAAITPSRVPFEESSVFAESPNADAPGGVTIDLHAGDVLYVPRHWWHHVSTPGAASHAVAVRADGSGGGWADTAAAPPPTATYALSVNTWLEHPADAAERLREALVRTLACALLRNTVDDEAVPRGG